MTSLTFLGAGWPSEGGGDACDGGFDGAATVGGGGLAAGPPGKGLRAGLAMMLLSDGGAGEAAGEARTLEGVADLRLIREGSLGGGICETTPAFRRIDLRLGCLNLNIFRFFTTVPSGLMLNFAFLRTGDASSTPGTLSGRGRFCNLLLPGSGVAWGVARPFCCEVDAPVVTVGFATPDFVIMGLPTEGLPTEGLGAEGLGTEGLDNGGLDAEGFGAVEEDAGLDAVKDEGLDAVEDEDLIVVDGLGVVMGLGAAEGLGAEGFVNDGFGVAAFVKVCATMESASRGTGDGAEAGTGDCTAGAGAGRGAVTTGRGAGGTGLLGLAAPPFMFTIRRLASGGRAGGSGSLAFGIAVL